MGAFVISPLPRFAKTEYLPVRVHPSPCVLLRTDHKYYDPIRHPDAIPATSHSRL